MRRSRPQSSRFCHGAATLDQNHPVHWGVAEPLGLGEVVPDEGLELFVRWLFRAGTGRVARTPMPLS